MTKIIKIEPCENYHYALLFDSGEKRLFDVRPYIKGTWFGELEDMDYFKKRILLAMAMALNGQMVRILRRMN